VPVKRLQTFRLHPELLRRAEDRAVLEDRTVTSVIEQALAELLAVPIADSAFPPGPVEVCRACRQGVLWRNRCPVCRWVRPRKRPREEAKRHYRPRTRT
jgi:hypothetical protein